MPNITKPDLSLQWAQAGDVLKPSDSKIQSGWAAEIPPRQWFNWLDNRQDQAIAHINQHGIAVWDALTEYQANISYVQGSNGTVYRCVTTNTNINPVADTGSNWRVAFLDANSSTGPVVATATQARAMTDNTTFISPLQLANAYTGINQSLSAATGKQLLPGGLLLQWQTINTTGSTTPEVFNFSQAFSQFCVGALVVTTPNPTGGAEYVQVIATTSTTFTIVSYVNTNGPTLGALTGVKIAAIGY